MSSSAGEAQGRVRALREKLSIQRLYQYQDEINPTANHSGRSTPLNTILESEHRNKENVENSVRKRIAQLEGVASAASLKTTKAEPSPPKLRSLIARSDTSPTKEEPQAKGKDEKATVVAVEKTPRVPVPEKKDTNKPEKPKPSPPVKKDNKPEDGKKKKDGKTDKMAENELEGVTIRLSDVLRTPEDLEKIPALKAEITRKKAAVDAQLMEGMKDQLEGTQSGMSSLSNGQNIINQIKEEMMNIDRLCREAKGMIEDGALPNLELIAKTQRNFAAVEKMKSDLETFNDRLAGVEQLLQADDQDMENQPNLLPAHYELTKLRDIRDDAIDQIQRANDSSSEATLEDYFTRLDEVIDWFDDHIGTSCMQLIPMLQADNRGLVVRLAVVIAEEEKNDLKVKALQDASKDHKELAERFKSINTGPKQVRGYKEKFLKCIEFYAKQQFDEAEEAFHDDPSKLDKSFKWFFNDLYVVQQGMQKLMPKKWKIFKTYSDIYHTLMHDWLIKFIDDPELRPPVMLAIVHWIDRYYSKMKKLGWEVSDLQPHVLDNRETELVGEWRQLIVKTVDEWMDRMYLNDRKALLNRNADALDNDSNGFFRTKTIGDMWRMLREQTIAAGDSERTDVTEGVVDAMFRALKSRQSTWEKLIEEETTKYKTNTTDFEGMQPLQDWLVAIANDQISCIDDDASQQGYLTRFKRDFENLVTSKYLAAAENEVLSLRDAYVDLSAYCMARFVFLVFAVDCRQIVTEFFTPKWYPEYAMKRIITTFEDYVADYKDVMYPSLLDIFLEELSEELLVRYLSSVRNKGVKFRRQDPFQDKFREDVSTAFEFFSKFGETFNPIKQRWRVVDYLVRMLESEKAAIVGIYEEFKMNHWDLQLSWVEAVLRSRDDFDRATLNAVKARAAEMYVERKEETVMSKVR